MNSVSGRIVARESGLGVANLVVEAFDLGDSAAPAVLRRAATNGKAAFRRLGSVTSTATGEFEVQYEPQAAEGSAARESCNLALVVSAPEDAERAPVRLYVSHDVRRDAGPVESFLIRLAEAELEKAGVQPPGVPDDQAPTPELVSRQLAETSHHATALVGAEVDARKLLVDGHRARTDAFRDDFLPAILSRLSARPAGAATSDTFVPDGASIVDVHRRMMQADLTAVINTGGTRAPVRTLVALTDEQESAVRGRLAPDGSISAADLRAVIGRTSPSRPAYEFSDPVTLVSREVSEREREAADALGVPLPAPSVPPPDDVAHEAPEGEEPPLQPSDIPRLLGRLTRTITSPEEEVLAGLEPRATQGSVAHRLQQLTFRPSPADVPALYDFHSLQVAFRNVWQEAIDEGVLTLAEAAYDEIVLAGGTPTLPSGHDPLKAILAEADAVMRARAATPPGLLRSAAAGGSGNGVPTARRMPWLSNLTGLHDWVLGDAQLGVRDTMGDSDPLPPLLVELTQRLQEPYAFTTFAASRQERSVNFGTIVTYRQCWDPKGYQAGKLAMTKTLTPRERQQYTKTVKRHRKRSEREVENHLRIRRDETAQTSRAEQEIIRKATTKTNFDLSSEATAKTGPEEVTQKVSFAREAGTVSEAVKKNFHESVVKASQEFKDEITVEVATEETEDSELVETGEIYNHNDGVTVNFFFYELQRLYQVSERIHLIRPVVLVAQEMPKPNEINEAWLISNDWILRRVLLDDSFAPALDYLSQHVVGDQVALGEMRTNITQQRAVIAELKQELVVVRSRIATYRNLLEQSMLKRAQEGGGGGGLLDAIPVVGDAIELAEDAVKAVGDFLSPDLPNVGDSRLDAIKEAIQRTVDEEHDLFMRVEREVTALNALTETYAKALAENYNHRMQVLRLRTHVKQNILYYMQAIWSFEPRDQQHLRLLEIPVPTFADNRQYRFAPGLEPLAGNLSAYAHRSLPLDGVTPCRVFGAEVDSDFGPLDTKPLAQVADLDNLLGYFGNYMIFPLKESNPLTDFMMEPYVVLGFDELTDPDDIGNWTLEEFAQYVIKLKERLSAEQFQAVREELKTQYERLITDPRRNGEEIIIPTGSLFIEAVAAPETMSEMFKELHRGVDVKLAQANLRQAEIEALRLADRLLHEERTDPNIEKKVIIQGGPAEPDVPVDDPN